MVYFKIETTARYLKCPHKEQRVLYPLEDKCISKGEANDIHFKEIKATSNEILLQMLFPYNH